MSAEMSFNETLNLKNVSANYNETESNIMNNEKELTHTEAEIEKALAERNKLQAELDRLTKKEMQEEHKLSTMKNRYKEENTVAVITALSSVAQFWRVLFPMPRATPTSR